jgi:hypothetical protein
LYGFGAGGLASGSFNGGISTLQPAQPANSGGGGAGKSGGSSAAAGTAGASGYCMISYWS